MPKAVIASPSEPLQPIAARYGLHAAYRLHVAAEFSAVFAYRRAVRAQRFTLHYRPSESGARLGVVVAKKLARHAVLRNLIKRIARESFRFKREGLPALDLVLRLASSPKGVSRRGLRVEIDALFDRLPRR